jgi:hypothetical protein
MDEFSNIWIDQCQLRAATVIENEGQRWRSVWDLAAVDLAA